MKPWRPGETRVFRYVHRSQPTPKGATVHGFVHSHHDQHSVLVELDDYASIEDCISLVCHELGVTKMALLSDRKAREIARPRQLIYWLARHATCKSSTQIGRALNRDHTSVLAGVVAIDELRTASEDWRLLSDRLLNSLAVDKSVDDLLWVDPEL